ncbi:hypothetical protein [Saccharopolyspora taberi]|uniref:Uncharacterized protein n=1 Tax=Saccharopolyspora taberi TaxID=60895 RepID=A0ABN3VL44_9PSEU
MSDEDRAMRMLRAANPVSESDVDTERWREHNRALLQRILATPRDERRGPVLRRPPAAVLIAAVAAAVLVLGSVLSRPPSASAAELLERAATAVRTTYQEIPMQLEAYQKSSTTSRHTEQGFAYSVERTVEVRLDGGGFATTTTSVSPPRFDTAEQQERWERSGRPPLPGAEPGGVSSGPVIYRVGPAQVDYEGLRALPTDPSTLDDRLRELAPGQDLFDSARQLLVSPGVPGPLRAALYRVIAAVPDIEVTEDSGSRVTIARDGTSLTFDPAGGALLAATGEGGRTDVVINSAGFVNCVTEGAVQPTSITLACADANYAVEDLRWSGWGGQAAEAAGTARVNSCDPSCAEGVLESYPVRVVFDRPRSCGLNLTNYTRATVHYLAAVPEGMEREDVNELPCTPE